jgi:hypothetical protein
VGGVEAPGDLGGEGQDLPLVRGAAREKLPQRLALEKLGDNVRGAVVRADVEDGQDVRVVERGDCPGLALEALQPLRVRGHVGGKYLDRHLAPETRVPRPVDLAHPASPSKPRTS